MTDYSDIFNTAYDCAYAGNDTATGDAGRHLAGLAAVVSAAKAEALGEAVALVRPGYRALMLSGVDNSSLFAANDALHGAADRVDNARFEATQ